MDAAGVGLAVVDLCIKSGKQMVAICRRYQSADREVRESILRIETAVLKTQTQVEALRDLWSDLDERVQVHHNTVLSLLYDKLQVGITFVGGLDTFLDSESNIRASPRARWNKVKYAMFGKKKLDHILQELERWQKMFDPSWYLLTRVMGPNVAQRIDAQRAGLSKEILIVQELRQARQLACASTDTAASTVLSPHHSIQDRRRILNTSAEIGSAANGAVVVDVLQVTDGMDTQQTAKDVHEIAQTLANVDPAVFGLLACLGVRETHGSAAQVGGFEFVFTVPAGLNEPQSLRTFLLTNDDEHLTLDDRFRLAQLLGRSVFFLHSAQIVHKNISPETILLFENLETGINSPYLVGFEKFRLAGGRTYMTGDTLWEKNLYRHPKRQGEQPEEMYKMQHDIYSLGVCLLEIGLGISFVHFDPALTSYPNPKGAVPNPILEVARYREIKDIRSRAFQIKRRLVAMAEARLPSRMGKVYTDVVLACLTCLDPNNQRFGEESAYLDEDGVLVGIRYIEKILYSLEDIRF